MAYHWNRKTGDQGPRVGQTYLRRQTSFPPPANGSEGFKI